MTETGARKNQPIKRYKYIEFHGEPQNRIYGCINTKQQSLLGFVRYYKQWRQWTFWPSNLGLVLSAGCCRDLADFLEKVNSGEIE